jgi:hypothetical protein
MAYIGVPQPSRAITSADIAQGAVTLNDISFTDMPANMDISGTIDKHTMRLAEGVTVTGDITISDNLILSKISDDGVGITLTNDSSTRTITGSGSIEASTLAQTPNASLTGMTGALGSGVTGTIGSGVTGGTGLAGAATGTNVFFAYIAASGSWVSYTNRAVIPFDGVKYDPSGVYTASTYRFTAPENGVYMFGFHVYTAYNDGSNSFAFHTNGTQHDRAGSTDMNYSATQAAAEDVMHTASTIIVLNASDYVTVNAGSDVSDVYKPHSHWWGCRLR